MVRALHPGHSGDISHWAAIRAQAGCWDTLAPEPLSLLCSQDLRETPAASVGAEHPPPVSIWEHLQMHLSLSMSLVLKSLPGWLMLLSLPAVPDRPFRWILRVGRGDTEACRGGRGGQCRKPPLHIWQGHELWTVCCHLV